MGHQAPPPFGVATVGEKDVGRRHGLPGLDETTQQQQQQRKKPNRHQRLRQTRFNEQAQEDEMIENLPWGDSTLQEPEDDCVRFYFINKNGLSSNNNFEEILEIGQATTNIGVSILGMAETNKDWSRPGLQTQSARAWRKFFGPSSWLTASSGELTGEDYQPGGVGLVVGGQWSGRICEKGSDPDGLGRWTYATLQGKANAKVTIVTAYQVCDDNISTTGPNTAYRQQWVASTEERHKTPESASSVYGRSQEVPKRPKERRPRTPSNVGRQRQPKFSRQSHAQPHPRSWTD